MNRNLSDFQIYSEPFMEMGNISAEGATKLLGKSLTPLELLLRETIQNSWDASLESLSQPRFEVRLRFLDFHEKSTLRKFLFELPHKNSKDELILNNYLKKEHMLVMEICDFGTKGLGGPFSAAKSISENEPNDFVNFVKNIGSHRDKRNGAGTYGFGKSSLFKFSKCNTILINTLTEHNDRLQNRFIGYALGSEYQANNKRFTGRHWWGLKKNLENRFSIDPIIDFEAKEISRKLGLNVRSSEEDKGTSLVILDPDLDEINDDFSQNQIPKFRNKLKLRIQEILLWWAWPKFTPREDNSYPMECRISIFEDYDELPNPMNIEPLNLLANALYKARSKVHPIFCQSSRPRKLLGYFGEKIDENKKIIFDQRFRDLLGEKALIPEKLSHFALLRPAELVVKYEKGNLKDDQAQWGAVFICDDDDEIEKAFAKSEPPAHNDWRPNSTNEISSLQKKFVISALRQIKKRVKFLSGEEKTELDLYRELESSDNSLAWLATELGQSILGKGIIGGADGLKSSSSKKTVSKKKTFKLGKPKNISTKFIEGKKIADFIMNLSGKEGEKVEIELKPLIVTEEGNEEFAPNGLAPKIIMFEAKGHFENNEFQNNLTNYQKSGKINPSFNLKKDFIEIKVSIEIPDEVAVTISAELNRL